MIDILILKGKSAGKDCPDWVPLDDGTRTGDSKYCNRSLECTQHLMASDYYMFNDYKTGELNRFDYFCTGIYALKDEYSKDEEVS